MILYEDDEEYLTSEDMESYQLYKVEVDGEITFEFEYETPMKEYISKGMHEFVIEKVWRSWNEEEQEWNDEILETKTVNTIPENVRGSIYDMD